MEEWIVRGRMWQRQTQGQLKTIWGSCSCVKRGREPQGVTSGHIQAKLCQGNVPGVEGPTALFQAAYFCGRILSKHCQFWFPDKPPSTGSPVNLSATYYSSNTCILCFQKYKLRLKMMMCLEPPQLWPGWKTKRGNRDVKKTTKAKKRFGGWSRKKS